jgi:putative lipoic acid-binding regulatory protein
MNTTLCENEMEVGQYPAPWGCSLIAGQESQILKAIQKTFGQHPFKVGELRKSSGGSWCALNVDTTVANEGQRRRFMDALRGCDGIRYVL